MCACIADNRGPRLAGKNDHFSAFLGVSRRLHLKKRFYTSNKIESDLFTLMCELYARLH